MASLLTLDDILYTTPSEIIIKSFDFVDEVNGVTIAGVTTTGTYVTAVKADGTTANSILSSRSLSGTTLSFKVSSTAANTDYLITCLAKTSTQKFQKSLVVKSRVRTIF